MVAFKEWQIVCDALACGRQSLLLRKGGIHEGAQGFSFAHDSFLLFPTKFHAQPGQVREGDFVPEREWHIGDEFQISHYARALFAVTVTDRSKLEALLPYHVYTGGTLSERFDWEEKGKRMNAGSIHVAFLEVFKLASPVSLIYEKKFGGCRSWLELPAVLPSALDGITPVLGLDEFEARRTAVSAILGHT